MFCIHFSNMCNGSLTLWVALMFEWRRLSPPLQRKVGYFSCALPQLHTTPTKKNPLQLDNMKRKIMCDVLLFLKWMHEEKWTCFMKLLYNLNTPPAAHCPPSVHIAQLGSQLSHGWERSLFGFLQLWWYHQLDWLFCALVLWEDWTMGSGGVS